MDGPEPSAGRGGAGRDRQGPALHQETQPALLQERWHVLPIVRTSSYNNWSINGVN